MTTPPSFTAAVSSELSERLAKTLRETTERISDERVVQIARLQTRIQDLEARGFIKRQIFSAPSPVDFERRFAWQARSTNGQMQRA